jgi:hypothetical protein
MGFYVKNKLKRPVAPILYCVYNKKNETKKSKYKDLCWRFKMRVMVVFDAVILLFGIYMVVSSLQMKKSGRINAMVIAEEEMKKCKDTAGFIAFIYWREALFGGIVAIVGLVGIINELTNFLGKLTLAELVIFLGSFLWFQNSLKTAREKFLHI